jgi:hypothetical protein
VNFGKDLDQVLEGVQVDEAAALANGEHGRRPIAATVGTYKKRIFAIETRLTVCCSFLGPQAHRVDNHR